MADGLGGVYVAVAHLQPLVEAGTIPPFLVVATDPNPDGRARAAEYLRGWSGGSDDFAAHERWLIEEVIPWAERTQRAADTREQRFIGGFSNGADLAWQLANAHPDLFGGALVHSPVGASASWVGAGAARQRWVVTGGTQEASGTMARGGQLPRAIAQAIERAGAPLRQCIGRWGHTGRIWRELSPGSVVWLLGLGDPAAAATAREQNACRTSP
jgi:enterochelin esterase-like enzyme